MRAQHFRGRVVEIYPIEQVLLQQIIVYFHHLVVLVEILADYLQGQIAQFLELVDSVFVDFVFWLGY